MGALAALCALLGRRSRAASPGEDVALLGEAGGKSGAPFGGVKVIRFGGLGGIGGLACGLGPVGLIKENLLILSVEIVQEIVHRFARPLAHVLGRSDVGGPKGQDSKAKRPHYVTTTGRPWPETLVWGASFTGLALV